jgi:hypothetical protein
MSHAPDCALVQFAHLDPATLKTPLICDCDQDDGPDSDDEPSEEQWDAAETKAQQNQGNRLGPRVTITGAAATAFRRFQDACQQLKAAQVAHAKALAAFTEAVVG